MSEQQNMDTIDNWSTWEYPDASITLLKTIEDDAPAYQAMVNFYLTEDPMKVISTIVGAWDESPLQLIRYVSEKLSDLYSLYDTVMVLDDITSEESHTISEESYSISGAWEEYEPESIKGIQ